jgi:propionyl-CoA carboxylase alpha chain
VIEEAPSPFISEATRKAMGEQAVQLAKAVKYQSAGTVEFVVGKDQSFYFLEMNTRLQVEHPVTEAITGLDLVEQMIRVAAGEKLSFAQADVKRNGWSIECRINAEDPFRNFLPSTGRLVRFQTPTQTMFQGNVQDLYGVRVDTGVQDGGEIPMFYDSMIAKLIVHGKDRHEAIAKMREALNGFVIRGISSNIPFQAALLAHPRFVAGDFNTGFIAEQYPKGFSTTSVAHDEPSFLLALAAVSHRRSRERAATLTGQRRHREVRIREDFVVVLTGAAGVRDHIPVSVRPRGSIFEVSIAGQTHEVAFEDNLRDIAVHGTFDSQPFCAQIERHGLGYSVSHNGASLFARVFSPRHAELEALMPFKAPPDLSKVLLSPMPGLLVDVAVQVGQTVRAGEKLAAIEAMKMENILFAAQDCVVSEVLAAKGDSLAVDQVIMRFQ